MKIPYEGPASLGREFIALGPDVVAAILLTLESGWFEVVAGVEATQGEVEMTERLRDGMRVALNRGDLAWGKQILVAPGTESRSTTSVLIPDGRTDIPVYVIAVFLTYGEHDPHAIIECKRLAGDDTHLCREYVTEGMDRFKNGKYGENHAAGFMAGYLLKGDEQDAAEGINGYLRRVSRIEDGLSSSAIVTTATFWRSNHMRTTAKAGIDIHHALLRITH